MVLTTSHVVRIASLSDRFCVEIIDEHGIGMRHSHHFAHMAGAERMVDRILVAHSINPALWSSFFARTAPAALGC